MLLLEEIGEHVMEFYSQRNTGWDPVFRRAAGNTNLSHPTPT
jgi:hypothetical protein